MANNNSKATAFIASITDSATLRIVDHLVETGRTNLRETTHSAAMLKEMVSRCSCYHTCKPAIAAKKF
jgi:hypothetical protein